MSTLEPIVPPPESSGGSRFRRSLTERGVIFMKENRPITSVATNSGSPLEISGLILVTVKGSLREISTGVKFEQSEGTRSIGSAAFVDSDELDEFLGAVTFISTAANQMASQGRDYTEVTYTTRDNLTIGFFQDGQKQQAFARLGLGSPTMFFGVRALPDIKSGALAARDHVNARRVAWELRSQT